MNHLPSPRRQALETVAAAIARQSDDAIKAAVSERVGREDWLIEDMINRLQLLQQDNGVTQVVLDGELIMEIHALDPGEFGGSTVSATRTIWKFRP